MGPDPEGWVIIQIAQKKLLDYDRAVPELESDLSAAKEQLENSKQSLEEKTVALIHARKHLRNARERNMVSCEAFLTGAAECPVQSPWHPSLHVQSGKMWKRSNHHFTLISK